MTQVVGFTDKQLDLYILLFVNDTIKVLEITFCADDVVTVNLPNFVSLPDFVQ